MALLGPVAWVGCTASMEQGICSGLFVLLCPQLASLLFLFPSLLLPKTNPFATHDANWLFPGNRVMAVVVTITAIIFCVTEWENLFVDLGSFKSRVWAGKSQVASIPMDLDAMEILDQQRTDSEQDEDNRIAGGGAEEKSPPVATTA